MTEKSIQRCIWAETGDLERAYHDREWGVPVHNDHLLFEFLILEGAQAGLSWSTILRRRESYRKAFDNFQVDKIAFYSEAKIQELLQNSGVIRNRLKVNAAVTNAGAFLKVQEKFGSFDKYIWSFCNGSTIHNAWPDIHAVPANTPLSDAISRDLRQKGFKFIGSTICYAFMQAVGIVNDHVIDCFRYAEINDVSQRQVT